GAAASSGSSASSARAAALNTALTDAAGDRADSPARVRWALSRLRHFGGVDGTATFHNKTGFHTLSFERGIIQSVSDTVVRKDGAKTTASALSAGETVFAGGPVVSGARDARLIIIRPSGPAGSGSANSSGSQSAQSSLT